MLVVADSSPLIVLVAIEQIDVLPKLFKQVIIPPAVSTEILDQRRVPTVQNYFLAAPTWLRVQHPSRVEQIPGLHQGELEALSLAVELRADIVLVDERKAYREAVARRLNAIGTIRVLERAAEEGLLDLKEAFDRLKRTDFWISHNLLNERLKRYLSQKRP